MTLTVELTAEEEARLRKLARLRGVDEATALRALIPTESRTWGAQMLEKLRAEDALGAWEDRDENCDEVAEEFRRLAEQRGPLPCN